MSLLSHTIYPVGDTAITLQWGEEISEEAQRCVLQAFHLIREALLPGVTDLVPAYHSLMVVYDTLHDYARRCAALEKVILQAKDIPKVTARYVEIPVCYDPSLGPDVEGLAREKGLGPETLIRIHSAPWYTVYMIGFLPGFPYMGSVSPEIATPRKSEPARCVPRGSVGIAGRQTGIYPLDSPGGWHIIGRTPLRLFEPAAADPVFLRPGDQVKFVPISLDLYHERASR